MTSLTGTLNLFGVSGTGTLYLTPPNPNQLLNSVGGPGSISPATIAIAVLDGELTDPPLIFGNDMLLPQNSTYAIKYVADDGSVLIGTWYIFGATFDIGSQVLGQGNGNVITSTGPAAFTAWYNPAGPSVSFRATAPDGSVVSGQVLLS